jgi:acetyltransferase-like isoleucine patch superfamily enzyme
MLIKNHKPLCAISYDTATYSMLEQFLMLDNPETVLHRIEPAQFKIDLSNEFQYINLVLKDFDERETISKLLDTNNLDRFSYVAKSYAHPMLIGQGAKVEVGAGCLIYPHVLGYSGRIGNDVIIHSTTRLAENFSIGNGCFLSGSIVIAGDCKIGDFCYIGPNVLLIDHIKICDHVKLLPGVAVRKSIEQPGVYYNPYTFELKKIDIL